MLQEFINLKYSRIYYTLQQHTIDISVANVGNLCPSSLCIWDLPGPGSSVRADSVTGWNSVDPLTTERLALERRLKSSTLQYWVTPPKK